MVELSRHEDFEPHAGRSFHFDGWHGSLRLARIDVSPQGAMPGASRVPFILIFHGPTGDILPEGLYRARIEDGPVVELYVMPIHTVETDRQDYQSVFN